MIGGDHLQAIISIYCIILYVQAEKFLKCDWLVVNFGEFSYVTRHILSQIPLETLLFSILIK